jgi:hypothetical protein
MVLFLFDNVIYVFLLLWLCILIVCLCMTTLTEVFPCFFLSYKANARVKPAKTGHGPDSLSFLCCSLFLCCCSMYFCVVLCIFMLFYVFLCCSMYCLFCDVLCIVCVCVCVYMCAELLPPGGYTIAVKYIISYYTTLEYSSTLLLAGCLMFCRILLRRDSCSSVNSSLVCLWLR